MSKQSFAISLAALLVLLSSSATASVVIHYEFAQLVSEADEIVHARVVDQRSEWQGQSIVTIVELEVIDCLKGERQAGDRVFITQHGGVVGDLAMMVPGAPTFRVGEETVLFLEPHPSSPAPLVMGLAQGMFTVVLDDESGRRMITRSLDGLALMEPDGQIVVPVVRPPAELRELELERRLSVPERLEIEPVWVPLDDFMVEIERNLMVIEEF